MTMGSNVQRSVYEAFVRISANIPLHEAPSPFKPKHEKAGHLLLAGSFKFYKALHEAKTSPRVPSYSRMLSLII